MFFCTNSEKKDERRKTFSQKLKRKNERRRKEEEKEKQKRVADFELRKRKAQDAIDQMEQRKFDENLETEFQQEREKRKREAEINVNDTSKTLSEFLSCDPNSRLSNWWSGDIDSRSATAVCMYCRRFNCIGFQCDSGTKVETDLFALFEKEVIEKKGSNIDKKEMKAHLTTRFRDHFRSDKCKGGGHKQITHCGLPFCLVVRIQHKYGQTCSTCEKAPCAFYQHFGDAFPDCMALMDTSKRPAWEV